MTWTRPFHGVTHLNVPKPYQITVEDYGTFSVLTVFNMQNKPFTHPLVNKDFGSLDDAKAHAENWAKNNT